MQDAQTTSMPDTDGVGRRPSSSGGGLTGPSTDTCTGAGLSPTRTASSFAFRAAAAAVTDPVLGALLPLSSNDQRCMQKTFQQGREQPRKEGRPP
ncbi:unnamed protein product [Lampetra fluviatilis]